MGSHQYHDNINEFNRKNPSIRPIGWKPELLYGGRL